MFKKNAKVSHAHMHSAGFIPGINKQVKASLDQNSCPGIEMVLGVVGLECSYLGQLFLVPYVNFQSIVLDKSETVLEKNAA